MLFIWQSTPIFSFIGYILKELFGKNWRRTTIYVNADEFDLLYRKYNIFLQNDMPRKNSD